MKGRQIVLDHLAGREVAALLVNGQLDDLLIDVDEATPRPGAIFRAICDRPLKGQGGMMVRLPDGQTGFLRQGKGLRPGQPVLVQVTGFAEDGKAVPVTRRLLFKSRHAIVTPDAPGRNISRQIRDEEIRVALRPLAEEAALPEGAGLILRSAAAEADPDEVAEDIAAMADLAAAVLADEPGADPEALTDGPGPHLAAWTEWTEAAAVETAPGGLERLGVLDQIDAARRPLVSLGAADMWVETTRALVAVDVNTRSDTSPAAALKANLAAARALPRALRLRGLGGQVTVDFAPLSKAHRRELEGALKAAVRACPVETTFLGWTPLGHAELTRKRERVPLSQLPQE